MTQVDFLDKYQQIPMSMPFASEGTRIAISGRRVESFSFPNGFDDRFAADPHSTTNPGEVLKRGHMNAIGNIATQNDFFEMCGGVITFNPELSHKIGGYPKGAILKYVSGDQIMEVVSLVDDNMIDFTKQGVDEKNWHMCNRETGVLKTWQIAEGEVGDVSANSVTVTLNLFSGSAPTTGYLNVLLTCGGMTPVSGMTNTIFGYKIGYKTGSSWTVLDYTSATIPNPVLLTQGTPIFVQLIVKDYDPVKAVKYKITMNP